jgi:hypothetical protein
VDLRSIACLKGLFTAWLIGARWNDIAFEIMELLTLKILWYIIK